MKIFTPHILYTLLLLIISTGVIFAQTNNTTGKISGSLLDENGKPMDFATVSLLKAQDSTVVKGTLSTESGAYKFDHVNSGSYIIKATVVGYQKATSNTFTIAPNTPAFCCAGIKDPPGKSCFKHGYHQFFQTPNRT